MFTTPIGIGIGSQSWPSGILSVTDGLQLQLDANDSSTITMNVSNKVSQWDDKSGQGNYAIQSVEVNKPTYTTSGISGRPSLTFAGSPNIMILNDPISLTGDFSIFYVSNGANVGTEMILGHSTQTQKIGVLTNNVFTRVLNGGSADTTVAFDTGDSISYVSRDSSDKVDFAYNNGSLNRLYSDVAQSGTSLWNLIGRGSTLAQNWDGDISEILVYNSKLSTVERNDVLNYLNSKWFIF